MRDGGRSGPTQVALRFAVARGPLHPLSPERAIPLQGIPCRTQKLQVVKPGNLPPSGSSCPMEP